jgi:hypothetical protein
MTLIRCWRYVVPMIQRKIDTACLIWIADMLDKLGRIEAGVFDPDSDDEEPKKTERSIILESMVRDIIRDWVPNADEIVEQMVSRIVPLSAQNRPLGYSALVEQHVVIDPYTLHGNMGTSGIEDDVSGEGEDVFDPWSELGV